MGPAVTPAPLPDPGLPWPIVMPGVALIAESESLRLRAYRCWAGVWTIGWGETDGVHPGDLCTKEQADRWLCDDLTDRTAAVRALLTEPAKQHQLAALVSLSYNIGLLGLRRSTVLRRHNAGDQAAAARAFGLWNKARNPKTGQREVLPGLTGRRAREAALYLTPEHDEPPEPMPQAVQAESSPVRGPIAGGGAVTIGAGVVTGMAQVGGSLSGLAEPLRQARALLVETLGVPPEWVLPLVLIAAGAIVIRWRLAQRREGWA
jgi:lysozyme